MYKYCKIKRGYNILKKLKKNRCNLVKLCLKTSPTKKYPSCMPMQNNILACGWVCPWLGVQRFSYWRR